MMKLKTIGMALACAALVSTQVHAVVVDLTQISEGEPAPGTTISLETTDGALVELEIEIVELEETVIEEVTETTEPAETPQVTGPADTAIASGETTTTGEPAASIIPEDKPKKKQIVTAVPVTEDGTASFVVGEEHEGKPLVLVVRSADGRVLERRNIIVSGTSVTLSVTSLALFGETATSPAPAAFTTGIDPVRVVDTSVSNGAGEPDEPMYGFDKKRFEFSVETEIGRMSRDTFNALRLQSGGGATILQERFASIDRDGTFSSINLSGRLNLGALPQYDYGSVYAIGSVRYGHSSDDFYGENISTGGQDLGILSPFGPTGGLGGGVNVSSVGGASDLNFLSYNDSYNEFMIQSGLEAEHACWILFCTGRLLKFYGFTSEDLTYKGRTNSNTLDFRYDADVQTHRLGVQLGTDIGYRFNDNFSAFVSGDTRIIQNFSNSSATLDLSGARTDTESASADSSFTDVGVILGAGARFDNGRYFAAAGGRFETWDVGVARITGERPLYIDQESRESYSAYLRFGVRWGAAPEEDFGLDILRNY